ncbi:MAG: hypothetical protein K8I60_08380 [Anaerolineae bacterium]|nr:hypothetical protein [Anaerolineae bacterium]
MDAGKPAQKPRSSGSRVIVQAKAGMFQMISGGGEKNSSQMLMMDGGI